MQNNKNLLVANFATVTDSIGTPIAKECRAVIYENNDLIQHLIHTQNNIYSDRKNIEYCLEQFYKSKDKKQLFYLHQICEYIMSVFDRIGFLMCENPAIRKKFLEKGYSNLYGRLWYVLLPYEKLIYKYPDFEKFGSISYFKRKCEIDYWLSDKGIKNDSTDNMVKEKGNQRITDVLTRRSLMEKIKQWSHGTTIQNYYEKRRT